MSTHLKLFITGNDTLAEVTRKCCSRHFEITQENPDVLWICYDTPLGADDVPDSNWVLQQAARDIAFCVAPIVLVSSQLPVGSTAALEFLHPGRFIAHSPENIRVAQGEADFSEQARVVVGRRYAHHDSVLQELFAPFTNNLILTTPETAECCKHALNCLLGLQIAFINEVARFCAAVGADANVVSQALLTERRVSPSAPLKPGKPFGGGHLSRDIYTVNQIARERGLRLPIIGSIKESNES